MSQNPYNSPGQGHMGGSPGNMPNMGSMNQQRPNMGMMGPNMRMAGPGPGMGTPYPDYPRPMGPGMAGPNMARMMGPGPGMVRGPGPGQYGPGPGAGPGGRMISPGPGGMPGGMPGPGQGPVGGQVGGPGGGAGPRLAPGQGMETSVQQPGGQMQGPGTGGDTAGAGAGGGTVTDGGGDQAAQQPSAAPPSQPATTGKVTPTPGQKEVNISTVCRIGQETVEEIVSRTQEVFSILKSLSPPVGAYSKMSQIQDQQNLDKQKRLNDVLNGIGLLFNRLRVCWVKCQENTGGMDFYPIESLIPLKDELQDSGRAELEKKRGESYRAALEEHNELVQQITIKNRHLKDIIDQMRNIIWEINTMLAMRTN